MAPGSYACQTFCVNPPIHPTEKQNEFADAQGLARRSNVGSNEALTPSEAPIPPFVSPPTKDFFTKFMKMFMETTQT